MPPQPPTSDLNTAILSTGVMPYLRRRRRVEFTVELVLVVIYEALVIPNLAPYAFGAGSSSSGVKGFTSLVILPLVIVWGRWFHLYKLAEDEFLELFAQANGFSYAHEGTVDETYGSIFRISTDTKVSDLIQGTYQGAAMRLFLCDVTTGSGRSRSTTRSTVIELDLASQLPQMLLVGNRSNINMLLKSTFPIKTSVGLEGDFSDTFTLYAAPGGEVNALEIFAPDVMAVIQDGNFSCDVEFAGSRIYLYVGGYINTRAHLETAFTFAKDLVGKVAPIAGRMKLEPQLTPTPVSVLQQRQVRTTRLAVTISIVVGIMILGALVGYVAAAFNPNA